MAEEKAMVKSAAQAPELAGKVWPFRRQGEAEEKDDVGFPVDICETDDAFFLVGEMPGVKKGDVSIRIDENQLSITGHFRVPLEVAESVVFREIPGADYHRTFTLSDAVDHERISAEMKDGVLKIRLDKSERVKPREITIT